MMRQQGREHVPAAGLCRDRIPQDWWISGFLAAIGLATVIPQYPDATAFILSVAAFLAAGLSGWWPRSSTMVTAALTAAFVLLGVVTLAVFAMDIPLLMACVKRNHRVRNITAILAAALQTAIIAPVSSDEGELLLNLLFCLSLIAAAWVMGSWISHYVTRLSRLENERQQMIHAVRVSLARNLHDTVASAMNRIIMRCEQVKLRGVEDPVMLQDIDFLLQEGRQAAVDLRSILVALRFRTEIPGNETWHVGSVQGTLDGCTRRLKQEGFMVITSSECDEESLPPVTRDTVGKILLETTTNVVRHGTPEGMCHIFLEQHDETSVEIAVINQFTPGTRRANARSFGLLGLRERVSLLGGEFEAGPSRTHWTVRAQLPVKRSNP